MKSPLILTLALVCCLVVTCHGQTCDNAYWSAWSDCFPGTASDPIPFRDRRYVLIPAETCLNGTTGYCFDGNLSSTPNCVANFSVNHVETESCTNPTGTALNDLQNLPCDDTATTANNNVPTEFRCSNGRCISAGLKCDFSDDCGDNSDENSNTAGCPSTDKPIVCGYPLEAGQTSTGLTQWQERYLKGIPGINKFSSGYDLLTGEFKSNVLSMAPFGSCRRVMVAGTDDSYYRLPGNVASYVQYNSLDFGTTKTFTSAKTLLNSAQNALQYDNTFGGLQTGLEGSTGLTQSKTMTDYIKQTANSNNTQTYVSQSAFLKTAKVTLEDSSSLYLSTSFLSRLTELPPNNFSNSKYLSLINDFGTHYVTSGDVGGEYSDTQVYSRCDLDSTTFTDTYDNKDWEDLLPTCVRASFYYNLDQEANPMPSECVGVDKGQEVMVTDMIKEKIVSVFGGGVSEASNIKFSLNKDNWEAWVTSVTNAPSINRNNFVLKDLSELVQSKSIPFDDDTRRQAVAANMKQAINIYLGAYNAEEQCSADCQEITNLDYYDYDEYEDQIDTTGRKYLTGSSTDYKCQCLYDTPPNYLACSASTLSISTALLFALIATLFMLFNQD